MQRLGLQGVVRGRGCITTQGDDRLDRPADQVNRQFNAKAPNELWAADFTFVAKWSGFAYVAFAIDSYARCIVGWRVAASMRTESVLDALEQALCSRRTREALVHHSDSKNIGARWLLGGLNLTAMDELGVWRREVLQVA